MSLTHQPHSATKRLAILVLSLLVVLTACGFSDDDAGESSTSAVFDETSGDDSASDDGASDAGADFDTETSDDRLGDDDLAQEDAPASTEDALAQPTGLTPADIGRDIIFRADISVDVADVAAAGREATQHIEALGGIVFGQTTVTEPSPRTVLTFKVAPDDFDTALDRLAGIGELVDQTISADDVTDRIVDLESRVTTAETSVDRLREFLANATTVQDVAALERELVDRETELETLRGQLRTLQDQVALATITLTIGQRGTDIADAEIDLLTGLGSTTEEACPGAAELDTDRVDTFVWCVEIENIGDATLTDLSLRSDNLGLRTRDFTIVSGDLDAIEPGAVTRAVIEVEVDDGRVRRRNAIGGLILDVTVEAHPADDPDRTLRLERSVRVFADDEVALPGFADSVQRGVDVIAAGASILLVIVGTLLPFIPLAAVIYLVVRGIRRRQAAPPTIEE